MHQGSAKESIQYLLEQFVDEEHLPANFRSQALQWYVPLLQQLATSATERTVSVVGIAGTQGSGKSTLAKLLQQGLQHCHSLKAVALSIDDFYLTHGEREKLAHDVHPLLITRGVPGTHDVGLACNVIDQLLHRHKDVSIPRFDKAIDDRKPPRHWDRINAPVDLVLLEGWCVGTPFQTDAELEQPINELERAEDTQGKWRRYANQQLRENYQCLFDQIDLLIMLQAPSFEAVHRWRSQQEEKLKQANRKLNPSENSKIMDEAQLRRFIQHYERLTRQSLQKLPEKADIIFKLNEQQQITECIDNTRLGP